jgi:hypothetical protein
MKKKAAQSVNESIAAALADIRQSTRAARGARQPTRPRLRGFGTAIAGMRTADAARDQQLYRGGRRPGSLRGEPDRLGRGRLPTPPPPPTSATSPRSVATLPDGPA